MKNLSEKIIEQLQDKHDAFLGTEGELSRQRFKDGLMWAIDTIKTLTEIHEYEKEYELEQLRLYGVSNSVICDDWIHEERVKQNDDTYCPICGKQLQSK